MEYRFHKHKGRRRGGRDHLIEILQCCSDDQEQQPGQGQRRGGGGEIMKTKTQIVCFSSGNRYTVLLFMRVFRSSIRSFIHV